MDAVYGLPVIAFGKEDAGAVNVFDGTTRPSKRGGDEGEALIGLFRNVGVVATYGASSRDVDVAADPDGAGEADDGFVGTGAGKVGAGGCGSYGGWMPD